MARIYFRQYYTTVVEKFLSTVVRCKFRNNHIPEEWHKFTTAWIDMLSESDKGFIYFVFDEKYYNSYAGVSCYPGDDFLLKHIRLYELERKYAIAAGLLADDNTEDKADGEF